MELRPSILFQCYLTELIYFRSSTFSIWSRLWFLVTFFSTNCLIKSFECFLFLLKVEETLFILKALFFFFFSCNYLWRSICSLQSVAYKWLLRFYQIKCLIFNSLFSIFEIKFYLVVFFICFIYKGFKLVL